MPSRLDAHPAPAAATPAPDKAAVDKALDALKTYDYGQDCKVLSPIDEAVRATHGDAVAGKALETRLAEALKSNVSRDAKDYVCRVLRVIGTAESVPALAGLLPDKDLSHMARYALQSIPAPEAARALVEALKTLKGDLLVGVIGSLGARRDAASLPVLVGLLAAADKTVACTAAHALGTIGTTEAGQALRQFVQNPPDGAGQAAADSCLLCAERLLADGHKAEAKLTYRCLTSEKQPKLVRLAATHGLLNVLGNND